MLKILLIVCIIWIVIDEIQKRSLYKRLKKQDTTALGLNTVIKWIENKNRGFDFSKYLIECGYKSIAIYGMGDLGKLLYEELKDTQIKVECFVDRNYESLNSINDQIMVVSPDNIKNVDVVVITPVVGYNDIVEMLMEIGCDIPTLSIRDIMFEIK